MEVEPLRVSYELDDKSAVVTVCGELDLVNAGELEDILDAVINQGAEDVSLDMQAVSYIDSESIRILLRTEVRLHEAGGRMIISAWSRIVGRTLEILGLDGLCCTGLRS